MIEHNDERNVQIAYTVVHTQTLKMTMFTIFLSRVLKIIFCHKQMVNIQSNRICPLRHCFWWFCMIASPISTPLEFDTRSQPHALARIILSSFFPNPNRFVRLYFVFLLMAAVNRQPTSHYRSNDSMNPRNCLQFRSTCFLNRKRCGLNSYVATIIDGSCKE